MKQPKKPAWQRVEDQNLDSARLILTLNVGGISQEWAERFLKRWEWWREHENRRKTPLGSEGA